MKGFYIYVENFSPWCDMIKLINHLINFTLWILVLALYVLQGI